MAKDSRDAGTLKTLSVFKRLQVVFHVNDLNSKFLMLHLTEKKERCATSFGFSLRNLFSPPQRHQVLQTLFTNANKHHQIAQSKIEFCNYLNYLFARVHYQIVIMPNAFFDPAAWWEWSGEVIDIVAQHARFSLSRTRLIFGKLFQRISQFYAFLL